MMATDDMESESWYQDFLLQQQQQAQEEGSTYENFQNEEGSAAPFVEENARSRHHAKKHRRAKKTHRSSAKRRTDEEVRAPKGGSGAGKLLDSESWFGEEPSADGARGMSGSLVYQGSSEASGEQDRVAGAYVGEVSQKKLKNNKKKGRISSHRRPYEDHHLVVPSGSHGRFPEESSWRSEESAASDPPGMVLSSNARKHVSTYDCNEVAGGAHVEGSESILMSLGGSGRKRSKKRTSKTARSGSSTADKRTSLGRQEKSLKDIIHPDGEGGGISVPYFALETEATSSTFVTAMLDDPPYGTETQGPSLQIGAVRVGGDDMETQDSPLVNNELDPNLDSFEDEYATIEAYRVEEEQPLQTVEAKPFRDRRVLMSIAAFGVLCLIIGSTIFLTTGNETPVASPADPRGPLQARLVINHLDDEQTLVEAQRVYDVDNNETFSVGFYFTYYCKVLPCLEGGDKACKVSLDFEKVYEPGCCIGENCTEEEKCFENCPPRACRNKISFCTNPSCIECDKADDGTDLYVPIFVQKDVNCLDTGYKKTDSGEVYKWAIVCGAISSAGQEELNRGIGEYSCIAARQGESISDPSSFLLPCQYMQLAECGCAPDDVFDFGLGRPEKPCRTREDCFILCGDAGEENAKQLCYSFGGIEWWEGANAFNQTMFWSPYEGFFNKTTIEIFDESPPS